VRFVDVKLKLNMKECSSLVRWLKESISYSTARIVNFICVVVAPACALYAAELALDILLRSSLSLSAMPVGQGQLPGPFDAAIFCEYGDK
jgi:hypothetical protein